MTKSWTYGVRNHDTILVDYENERDLPDQDFLALFRFYVLYSPCNNASLKGISLKERGWEGGIWSNGLGKLLDEAKPKSSGPFHLPIKDNGKQLHQLFAEASLEDGKLSDVSTERAVTTISKRSENIYLRLFRHVRNCFAHGRFKYLVNKDSPEGMFVMEDRDRDNYTARMVLGKTTLLSWARIIEAGPRKES